MSIKNYSTHTKKYRTLISALHSIYRLVNSTYELKDLLIRLSRLLCQIFSAQDCTVMLMDPTNRYSIFKCQVCEKKRHVADTKTRITDRIALRVIRKLTVLKQERVLGIPLICDDMTGLVIVKRGKPAPAFDDADQQLLMTLAEQVIIAIRNLQLYEEQQRIILGSIKSMVTLLDMRVPQEYTHSPYFSRLVMVLGNQMHLDQKQIQSLRYASLLHDAGKVDIPPEILTKTTKLTPKEYKIVKRHPLKGALILRPFQILKPVIPIITHHHEKYNGTGYPSRLKKGQIPLGSRIMAVADAFEAMVYGRPYRERKDINSALKEIKKKSGTQFDPKVVEAFLKVIKKVGRKYLQPHK